MITAAGENSGRRLFDKAIGAIAVELGLISDDSLQHTLTLQTRFLALHIAEKPIDTSGSWHDSAAYAELRDEWDKLAEKSAVSEDMIKEARQRIDACHSDRNNIHGMPAKYVPATGELLIAENAATADIIHGLLVAQAAQRILDTVERMVAGNYQDGEILSIEDIRNSELWERIKTNSNPEYVTGNQQIMFIAKLLEAAITTHPPLAETTAIEKAEAALIILSIAAFQEAADRLPAIGKQTDAVIKEATKRWNVALPVTPHLVHSALQAVSSAIEAADISLGQRFADEKIRNRRNESRQAAEQAEE